MCPLEVRKYLQMASRQEAGFTLKTSCSAPQPPGLLCRGSGTHQVPRKPGPRAAASPSGNLHVTRDGTGGKALPHVALESFGRDVISYTLLWSNGRLLQDHRPGWGGSKGGSQDLSMSERDNNRVSETQEMHSINLDY